MGTNITANMCVSTLLIVLLIIDIVVTAKKVILQRKLWDLIKNGEVSYIRALREFTDIQGYKEEE